MQVTSAEQASLTLSNVEIALEHLTSGSPHLKQAEAALLSWQDEQPNAYTNLLLCAKVRLAALLTLKAVISKCWKDKGRSSTRHYLEETTRSHVRRVLLSLVTTGENPLQQAATYDSQSIVHDRTVQSAAAACLVQVARLDLPKNFQELIPTLVTHVLTASDIVQRRNAAYVLEAILQELSEKRLLRDKQYMQFASQTHVAVLLQETIRLVTLLSTNGAVDATISETILLLIRVLHYMMQSSLPRLVDSSTVNNKEAVDSWFKIALDCSSALLSDPSNTVLSSLCKEMWELVVDTQQAHPIAFGPYLEAFLQLFYNVLGRDETTVISEPRALLAYLEQHIRQPALLSEELLILALQFLANVISCSYYIPNEATNAAVPVLGGTAITSRGDTNFDSSQVQYVVHIVWDQFFTKQRLEHLCDVCIHLMVLSQDRIAEWEASPEDFDLTEEHMTAEDDVSAAAQNLYCSLIESVGGKQVICPRLIALLNDGEAHLQACRVETEGNELTPSAALLWESLYTATGLSVNVLEEWDRSEWFRRILSPCLVLLLSSHNGKCLPLLRRRIVWLIGCMSSRLSSDCAVCKTMVEIIAASTTRQNDHAVKLATVRVLSTALSNFDEVAQDCVSIAEIGIRSLYAFANECEHVESQTQILDAISHLLTYLVGMGRDVSNEVANAAVAPLGQVWNVGDVLIRVNVLSILNAIASSVGPRGVEQLLSIALPIIDDSMKSSAEHSVAETLLLWLSILRFKETYSDAVGSFFVRAVNELENDLEHVGVIMMIAEAYIIKGGQAFLAAHGELLCKMLKLTVGEVRPRGAKYVGLVLEALLRECPGEGGLLLARGGIVTTMLESCALNHWNRSQCEPDRVVALYLNAFARILMVSPTLLDTILPFARGEMAFDYNELIQLYERLLTRETNAFSLQLWLKFLLLLLPIDSSQPESRLSRAFIDSLDVFLSRCVEILPVTESATTSAHYQVNYDRDEETIETGIQEHEIMMQNSLQKDELGKLELRSLVSQKLGALCSSENDLCKMYRERIDPALLSVLKCLLAV